MRGSHLTLTHDVVGTLNIDGFDIKGVMTTNPLPSSGWISDSVAAGTALMTGYRTENEIISQSPGGQVLKITLEITEESGKSRNIVSTTRITHANPTCYAAHMDGRNAKNGVAEQPLTSGAEVIFGGGLRHFLPKNSDGSRRMEGMDLISEFEKVGYEFIEGRKKLFEVDKSPVLELFAMSYELDRSEDEPS